MTNYIVESLGKRRKKIAVVKVKLTSLQETIVSNLTLHDLFTILLLIVGIVVVFIL